MGLHQRTREAEQLMALIESADRFVPAHRRDTGWHRTADRGALRSRLARPEPRHGNADRAGGQGGCR